jgi:hypothetical protein
MRLGKLIDKLEQCDQTKTVRFDFGGFVPTELDSYRGYYEDLALGFQEYKDITVAELLAECKKAIGKTFYGYKGGDYVMDEATTVWVSNYGRSDCTVIDGILELSWCVVIETKYEVD